MATSRTVAWIPAHVLAIQNFAENSLSPMKAWGLFEKSYLITVGFLVYHVVFEYLCLYEYFM